MARRYIDGGGNLIPGYAMPIENDTASLANAAYLRKVVDGDITSPPVVRPSTTDKASASSVGYVNVASESLTSTFDIGPDMDEIGLASLVNIGTVNMELEASVVHVAQVLVNPTAATIPEGDTQQFTVTIIPDNATDKSVTWESTNTSVATIDSSGLATGVSSGTAPIRVTTTDGGKTNMASLRVTTT